METTCPAARPKATGARRPSRRHNAQTPASGASSPGRMLHCARISATLATPCVSCRSCARGSRMRVKTYKVTEIISSPPDGALQNERLAPFGCSAACEVAGTGCRSKRANQGELPFVPKVASGASSGGRCSAQEAESIGFRLENARASSCKIVESKSL